MVQLYDIAWSLESGVWGLRVFIVLEYEYFQIQFVQQVSLDDACL